MRLLPLAILRLDSAPIKEPHPMNRAFKLIAIFSLTFACALPAAFGQLFGPPHELLTVNEFGQGVQSVTPYGPYILINVPGAVAQDPFSGLSTMSYPVQLAASPGDVLIYEDAAQTVLSDIIRFDGQGRFFFFSQLEPGETPNPSDVAQLPAPLTQFPTVSITETNLDFGSLGADYLVPASTLMPGSDANLKEFLFITEVPEPATVFLLLFGAGFLLLRQQRMRCLSPNCFI
jgi:hypothetical protein